MVEIQSISEASGLIVMPLGNDIVTPSNQQSRLVLTNLCFSQVLVYTYIRSYKTIWAFQSVMGNLWSSRYTQVGILTILDFWLSWLGLMDIGRHLKICRLPVSAFNVYFAVQLKESKRGAVTYKLACTPCTSYFIFPLNKYFKTQTL